MAKNRKSVYTPTLLNIEETTSVNPKEYHITAIQVSNNIEIISGRGNWVMIFYDVIDYQSLDTLNIYVCKYYATVILH